MYIVVVWSIWVLCLQHCLECSRLGMFYKAILIGTSSERTWKCIRTFQDILKVLFCTEVVYV